MKTALLLALLGACVAVSYATYDCYGDYEYKCVKDDYKKCKAIEVCEDAKKEKCGYDYCDYGYVCASKKKAVCKDFIALKKKCEKKKVCKEIKKPCGYDYCGYDEECVKEKICEVKYGYGRRLMGRAEAEAEATATASADYYEDRSPGYKKYGKVYYDDCDYCKKSKKLKCYDAYKCEKKEPCKEVLVKKCVKAVYRPGYDVCHGGHEFYWDDGYYYGAECGDEYCGEGYKCAYVYYQKCSGEECGDHYCDYGYECVAEDGDCKKYAYLETICKDVYEPTCVALGYYAKEYYYPKCKTVYKCDKDENICGGEYCGYGYTCAVRECGKYYEDPYEKDDHEDPYEKDDHEDPYYKDDDYYYKDDPYYVKGDDHKDDHEDPYYKDDDYYKDDPYYGKDDDYYGKDKKPYRKGKKGHGKKKKDNKGGTAYSSSHSYAGPGEATTYGVVESTGNAKAETSGSADTHGGYADHYGLAHSDEHDAKTEAHGNAYSDGHTHASGDVEAYANSEKEEDY